jgi:CheY-like chemotaxis protein
MNQRTVLVVEDDAAVRSLVAEVLDDAGYTVLEATCGQMALQLAQEHVPSVVLTDHGLPDMSGFDLLDELRRHDASRHIPVMLVSGRAQQFVSGIHGVDRVLAKPFDIFVLVQQVDDLASHPRAAVA